MIGAILLWRLQLGFECLIDEPGIGLPSGVTHQQ